MTRTTSSLDCRWWTRSGRSARLAKRTGSAGPPSQTIPGAARPVVLDHQTADRLRRALIALTPTADAIGVTWKYEDAYDEWDLIEDVLFDVYVASAVRGDVARFGSSQPFAEYGSGRVRYCRRSWFEVLGSQCQGPRALVRLSSASGFGEIQVVRLDSRDEARTELVVPWTPQLRFVARLRSPDGQLTRVEVVRPTESAVQRTRPSTRR